jgi:hypothetical protein
MFFYLKGKKGKADTLVSFSAMNAYKRNGSTVPLIHISGTRWMWIQFNSIQFISLSNDPFQGCKPHGYINSQKVHLYVQSSTNNC